MLFHSPPFPRIPNQGRIRLCLLALAVANVVCTVVSAISKLPPALTAGFGVAAAICSLASAIIQFLKHPSQTLRDLEPGHGNQIPLDNFDRSLDDSLGSLDAVTVPVPGLGDILVLALEIIEMAKGARTNRSAFQRVAQQSLNLAYSIVNICKQEHEPDGTISPGPLLISYIASVTRILEALRDFARSATLHDSLDRSISTEDYLKKLEHLRQFQDTHKRDFWLIQNPLEENGIDIDEPSPDQSLDGSLTPSTSESSSTLTPTTEIASITDVSDSTSFYTATTTSIREIPAWLIRDIDEPSTSNRITQVSKLEENGIDIDEPSPDQSLDGSLTPSASESSSALTSTTEIASITDVSDSTSFYTATTTSTMEIPASRVTTTSASWLIRDIDEPSTSNRVTQVSNSNNQSVVTKVTGSNNRSVVTKATGSNHTLRHRSHGNHQSVYDLLRDGGHNGNQVQSFPPRYRGLLHSAPVIMEYDDDSDEDSDANHNRSYNRHGNHQSLLHGGGHNGNQVKSFYPPRDRGLLHSAPPVMEYDDDSDEDSDESYSSQEGGHSRGRGPRTKEEYEAHAAYLRQRAHAKRGMYEPRPQMATNGPYSNSLIPHGQHQPYPSDSQQLYPPQGFHQPHPIPRPDTQPPHHEPRHHPTGYPQTRYHPYQQPPLRFTPVVGSYPPSQYPGNSQRNGPPDPYYGPPPQSSSGFNSYSQAPPAQYPHFGPNYRPPPQSSRVAGSPHPPEPQSYPNGYPPQNIQAQYPPYPPAPPPSVQSDFNSPVPTPTQSSYEAQQSRRDRNPFRMRSAPTEFYGVGESTAWLPD